MSFKDLANSGARELSDYQSQATRAVEASVFKLAGSVSQLKKLVDVLGTAKDTVDHRHKIAETNTTIQQLAKSIKDQLTALHDDTTAAAAAGPAGAGGAAAAQQQQQLKAKRLLQDFASILQDYKSTQKVAAEREAATLPKPAPSSKKGGKGAKGGDGVTAPLLDLEAGGSSSRGGAAGDGVEDAVRQQAQRQAEVARLDDAISFNESLIEERDHGIAEIQRQIGEVNEMFQDLAVLINDQGAQLQTIDEQITTTAERVKDGQRELVKANRSSRSYRNKCLWVWLIAAVVVSVILILLLA